MPGLKQWWIEIRQIAPWFLGILAAVLFVWVVYAKAVVPWLSKSMITTETGTAYGQFGDMFGGLNTLFAGLAFAFVAVAAYFQRQTMHSQRDELEATKAQGALQAFEPLFFQLLKLFRELQMQAHVGVPAIAGSRGWDLPLQHPDSVELIREIAMKAKFQYSTGLRTEEAKRRAEEQIRTEYLAVHRHSEGHLGPMFRTFYHAVRLIADSGLPPETQVRYANIARGLLGGDFLMLLMLNCLSEPGVGFKPFVEHFGLLKHIRRDPRELDEFIASFFEPSATLGYRERLTHWGAAGAPQLPK